MTLILSQVGYRWALQVADRLVTRPSSGGAQPIDSFSNKTIVYEAANGVASLSYTGAAYIADQPTDAWLAETLLGERVTTLPEGEPVALRFYTRRRSVPTMGRALITIADSLSDVSRVRGGALREKGLGLIAAGWLWYRRKHPRPFLAHIQPGPSRDFQVAWAPRLQGTRFWIASLPPGYITGDETAALTASAQRFDLEQTIDAFVDCIRTVAERAATVGPDCIVVSISHPLSIAPTIDVWYQPLRSGASLRHGNEVLEAAPSFSPWAIGPNAVLSPSMMVGGTLNHLALGRYTLSLQGPIDPNPPFGIGFYLAGQRRPRGR